MPREVPLRRAPYDRSSPAGHHSFVQHTWTILQNSDFRSFHRPRQRKRSNPGRSLRFLALVEKSGGPTQFQSNLSFVDGAPVGIALRACFSSACFASNPECLGQFGPPIPKAASCSPFLGPLARMLRKKRAPDTQHRQLLAISGSICANCWPFSGALCATVSGELGPRAPNLSAHVLGNLGP